MPYAFYFDSRFCSGCKACQVACKDHHHLPVGVLWRRVYEITGGSWQLQGAAWAQDIFAYNLSIACNHCQAPICAEVCPAGAITVRPDGIVLLNSQHCLGCQYCAWVCPYSAPQYDPAAGVMTKCDFCVDNLEQGLPPSCVSACPMRALDFGELAELAARHPEAAMPPPLPPAPLTRPALLITPHQAAGQPKAASASLGNREEVY
ncbi:MAG: dimethylsulfoxide reductase subunit B [Anaerolineales bacterium]|jgi:anaerobic dimethyl sulfoxide reductase subunit B (iron-sulfur subunit)|nr:dimethylsulfoxide reductase subunit B [Anaerolineales bacterium]